MFQVKSKTVAKFDNKPHRPLKERLYHLVEVFLSIQGEGARVGTPNIFVRFSECNLSCPFCDTPYQQVNLVLDPDELIREIGKYPCRSIVFTGGEPALQLDQSLVRRLKSAGYYLAVETNGMFELPEGLDFVCVSPKTNGDTIKVTRCDEVKFVLQEGDPVPETDIEAEHYWLSPMNHRDTLNPRSVAHCTELVKRYPRWKLNTQVHKILGIR